MALAVPVTNCHQLRCCGEWCVAPNRECQNTMNRISWWLTTYSEWTKGVNISQRYHLTVTTNHGTNNTLGKMTRLRHLYASSVLQVCNKLHLWITTSQYLSKRVKQLDFKGSSLRNYRLHWTKHVYSCPSFTSLIHAFVKHLSICISCRLSAFRPILWTKVVLRYWHLMVTEKQCFPTVVSCYNAVIIKSRHSRSYWRL